MTTTKKLTAFDKRMMLLDAIELVYKTGGRNESLVGNPLSFYNFDKVFEYIVALNEENIEQGGDDFFEYIGRKTYYGYKIKR
jgi:hypothetical protein